MKKLKALLKKLQAQIKTLATKEDITDKESKELEGLIAQSDKVKTQIKALKIAEEAEAEEAKEAEVARQAEIKALALELIAEEAPAINDDLPGIVVTPDGDEADRLLKGKPFKSLGEQLRAVYAAADPGIPMDKRLYAMKATGMGEGVGAEGGFLVQHDFSSDLLEPAIAAGQLASRVGRLPLSANSNGITVNAVDETSRATGSRWGGLQAYWLGEGGTKTASKPSFRQINLRLRKLIGLIYATDELLQDAVALESLIVKGFKAEFAWMLDDAIYNGLGGYQPTGFMASDMKISVAKETGQAAATVVTENIVKMYSRRLGNSSDFIWLYNQDIEPQLFTMSLDVGTGGMPVYMPPGGLADAPYARIMGRPAFSHEACATLGSAGDIALVNPSEYMLIEREVESASSIHVQFTTDETAFRFVLRVDGQPTMASAITPANSTKTQSAFVRLAARA